MSNTEQEFQGWKNYETWVASMMLSGNYDAGMYHSFEEWKAELDPEIPFFQKCEALKEWFEDLLEVAKDCEVMKIAMADLGSIWRVDFYEIGELYLKEES